MQFIGKFWLNYIKSIFNNKSNCIDLVLNNCCDNRRESNCSNNNSMSFANSGCCYLKNQQNKSYFNRKLNNSFSPSALSLLTARNNDKLCVLTNRSVLNKNHTDRLNINSSRHKSFSVDEKKNINYLLLEEFKQVLSNKTLIGIYVNGKESNNMFNYSKKINDIFFYCIVVNNILSEENIGSKTINNLKLEFKNICNLDYNNLPLLDILDISKSYSFFNKFGLRVCPIKKISKTFTCFESLTNEIENFQIKANKEYFKVFDKSCLLFLYKIKDVYNVLDSSNISQDSYLLDLNNSINVNTRAQIINIINSKKLITIIKIKNYEYSLFNKLKSYLSNLFSVLKNTDSSKQNIISETNQYIKNYLNKYFYNDYKHKNYYFYKSVIIKIFNTVFNVYRNNDLKIKNIPAIIKDEFKSLKEENYIKNLIINELNNKNSNLIKKDKMSNCNILDKFLLDNSLINTDESEDNDLIKYIIDKEFIKQTGWKEVDIVKFIKKYKYNIKHDNEEYNKLSKKFKSKKRLSLTFIYLFI